MLGGGGRLEGNRGRGGPSTSTAAASSSKEDNNNSNPSSNYYAVFEKTATTTIGIRSKKRPLHRSTSKINLNNSSCPADPLPSSPSKQKRMKLKNETFLKKRSFGPNPPPSDINGGVDDEDSLQLFELFNANRQKNESSPASLSISPSTSSSSSFHNFIGNSNNIQPLVQKAIPAQELNASSSYIDLLQTPPAAVTTRPKKRQKLTPVPIQQSNWAPPQGAPNPFQLGGVPFKSRVNLQGRFEDESDSAAQLQKQCQEDQWTIKPPIDWSLKTKLILVSSKPFGFHSSGLKSSEESSGTSAFARCIDIEPASRIKGISDPVTPPEGSQLDTSIGAQFHQCCLYWQHPTLPAQDLFPREGSSVSFSSFKQSSGTPTLSSSATIFGGIRMEQKVLDVMLEEWVHSFRSIFQLLRTKQCPYFYVCTNQFTALFCAAGIQGLDYLQAYVTPSSKGFRDSLTKEGIEFVTPCSASRTDGKPLNQEPKKKSIEDSDDEEPDKWLDEMGISQDVSVSQMRTLPETSAEEKNKSSLIVIAGTHTLAFFNHLMNTKNLLVTPTGPFAGLPPTLLSPVAFHGATMKQLKVKQGKTSRAGTGESQYCIEMAGPILPHVIHLLCPLLLKTVQDFKIRPSSLSSTVNLNLHARHHRFKSEDPHIQTSAFILQNLSDCGLSKRLLETFCRTDRVDTISNDLHCKHGQYQW